MRKSKGPVAVAGALVVTLLAGCTGSGDSGSGGDGGSAGSGETRVGVILAEVTSSPRWKQQDPGYFTEAFRAAGIAAQVRTTSGDGTDFQQIADSMINDGVKVLIITSPDSSVGKSVIVNAHQKKVTVIDYDRLTVGGGADYIVGFDPEEIGRMQGYGLVKCLGKKPPANPMIAELNGAPSDHNADQLTVGHDFVLTPKYDDAEYTKGPSQYVPGWAPVQARDIFVQMLDQQPRINGVLAADDGIANAAIAVLRGKKRNGEVPVTGQNATIEGLRNILTGDQCMTVYKRIKLEAQTAANIAVQVLRGQNPAVGTTTKDPESDRQIPFVSLVPLPITIDEVKDVVADGFVAAAQLCTGTYAQLCRDKGVKL
ncbi:sugar ABC transporter substrate-binding protein [Paractinoplanes durhamensis]|uniref:Sugar ABC transporter substrate-binding protein n=1 Tax=Paractinoplanes durhamensis TaxID=113563 RepID=A0ABQ3YX31_9ACTN|nr:substrate-binding domain-containing protein [Actinoplanes durhamensis]GIE02149.1 sugar ABC transporter substrate-binding protein [Actinoplanes durhamensis]